MNKYYGSPADLAPGTKARSVDINTIDQAVDAAFDKLPDELALKTGTVNYAVNKSNQANAYAVDLPAAVQAYVDGLEVKMRPGADNTGACTLNVNGLGAIAIKRQDGTDAQAGDLVGASPLILTYMQASNTFRLPPLANAQVTAAAASAQAAAQSAAAAAGSAGAAAGSAQTSSTKAGEAAQSATAAGQSAGAAAQSAGTASTKAGEAAGSAQAAAQSAANLVAAVNSASQSAGTANTKAGEAAGSATAAAESAGLALTRANAAKGSQDAAATSAGQASGSAIAAAGSAAAATNTANQLQTAVAGSATAAATSAQQAATARDAAILASQVATAPTENLAAIAKQLHKGAVVDVFVYDTSKDSDGGAWRQRCRHTSWENEALVPGKWLGIQAGTGGAVSAGGVVGDYFQHTADGVYYRITAIAPNAEVPVYRGNTREFPALAAIVVEAGRVVIYDATTPGLPMWMVFKGETTAETGGNAMPGNGNTSVCALNGSIFVGNADTPGGTWLSGLWRLSFLSDDASRWMDFAYFKKPSPLAQRHIAEAFVRISNASIAGRKVNDVAAVVLPDAPIDAATDLPVPTVVAATDYGVTVLKHDGTKIVSSAVYCEAVRVNKRYQVEYTYYGHVTQTAPLTEFFSEFPSPADPRSGALIGNATGFNTVSNYIPNPLPDPYSRYVAHDAAGGFAGLLRLKRGALAAQSMVAAITNTYNTGWLSGDNRAAWLADTVAETVNASNKVTNSNFATGDLSSINEVGGCVLSVVNGRLRGTKTAATYYGEFYYKFDGRFVPGRAYTISFEYLGGNYSHAVGIYYEGGGKSAYLNPLTNGGPRTISATFVARAGGKVGIVFSGDTDTSYAEFDLIVIQEAEPDRSIYGRGMIVNGAITKAPVAPGAQLVAYSGFTVANYLEQPSNPALDFGTGDFFIAGWVKKVAGKDFVMYARGEPTLNEFLQQVLISEAGSASIGLGTISGGFSATFAPEGSVQDGLWTFVAGYRRAGQLRISVNGRLAGTPTGSAFNCTHPTASVRVGTRQDGYVTNASIALLRASATAPTDEQIAQIYRDELALFQPGAQCTIAGEAGQVINSLAYDDTTDLLHVSTDFAYRSAFNGLVRVESEWHAGGGTGGALIVAASGGCVLVGGNQAARYSQSAIRLRDELRRRAEARRAMAREEIPLDFDGIAAQTLFPLPIGFTVKGVFVAGSKKRRGPTKDYTVTFDGYREIVVFGVSPGATWVQVTTNRS